MKQPLLTIAIPTYNRAQYLQQCLHALLSQVTEAMREQINFIVSDNASGDHTTEVVNSFISNGYIIDYYRNAENLGADNNIAACFTKATGKYVWIFSDDDFLLPGYLKQVFDLLNANELGALHINALWYTDQSQLKEQPVQEIDVELFTDPLIYAGRINYWTTFITGNVINKLLFVDLSYVEAYKGSSLVQLSWTLPSIFKGRPNAIINNRILACKADNTGGYQLMRVFGTNFNSVMDRLIKSGMIDKRIKRMMNNHLLNFFFPMFINKTGKGFESESPIKTMVPVFWSYRSFWTKIFPILFRNKYLGNVSAQ